MSKFQIIGLVLIALAMGFLVTMMMNFKQDAVFTEILEKPGTEFKFTGELMKGEDYPIHFDPRTPNQFSFFAKDREGGVQKIRCFDKKPFDFEKVDEVVLKLKLVDGEFHGRDLLTKCPSKYDNGEIEQKAAVE